jgi:hypothetical protein
MPIAFQRPERLQLNLQVCLMPYACRRELQVGHNRNLYLTDDQTYVQLATGREG